MTIRSTERSPLLHDGAAIERARPSAVDEDACFLAEQTRSSSASRARSLLDEGGVDGWSSGTSTTLRAITKPLRSWALDRGGEHLFADLPSFIGTRMSSLQLGQHLLVAETTCSTAGSPAAADEEVDD